MDSEEATKKDAEDEELEKEANEAFDSVMKNTLQAADSPKDDEFEEAFDSSFSNAIISKGSKENAQILENRAAPNKEVIGNGKTEVSRERKGSSLERDKPPLPEFALDLMTRTKSISNKDGQLSPTHSAISGQSNDSSERGWSSDPESFRHRPDKTLNQVKEEWDHVGTVTAGVEASIAKSPLVTFREAIFHMKTANMDEYAASIKPTIKHRGLSLIWHAIAGPRKMKDGLIEDRDLIFTLALCPLDNHEAMHMMMLQTIYKKLTATDLDCPRYGAHWESIGFQGEDPSTDLRGCGILGLLTTLNFVSSPVTSSLAIDVYRLSEDEVQNFPFCVMGINITRIALQIFREGKLNKECNIRSQVFEVFCELYSAIYFTIYRIWKTQHKTISDSGFVIHDVETSARKNPIQLMRNFQKAMNEKKVANVPTDVGPALKQGGAPLEKVDKFVGVCDLQDKKEEVHLV